MSQRMAYTPMGPIEYRLEGSGPTVMVLNGGHCSRDTRLSHERLVEVGFSVLTPSRSGYDDIPSETGRTVQEAADVLAALLDVLQIIERPCNWYICRRTYSLVIRTTASGSDTETDSGIGDDDGLE